MNNPLLGVEIPLEEIPKSHFAMLFDFQEIRRQIRPLFNILGKVPSSDLERILSTGPSPADTQIQIDEKLLAEAEVIYVIYIFHVISFFYCMYFGRFSQHQYQFVVVIYL